MSERWQDRLAADAAAAMPPHLHHYVAAGAREGVTAAEAADAWSRVRFSPRVLRGGGSPDTTTSLLGARTSSPLGIAPTSMQRVAHPEGEVAMARAARDAGVVVVVSSNAGMSFEDIGAVGATWWVQAYLTADRGLIEPALRGAAQAGASAVVLTADTPVPGTKYDVDDDAFGDLSGVYGSNHPDAVRGRTPGAEHARDLGPADVAWVGDVTGLPVVLKGVLRADDARRAVAAGARGVWVSNHGGRQLDRSVATADALTAVCDAVGEQAETFVDGGVRSGLDVLAALALGARGVFLGRLPLWALGAGGPERVTATLETLRAELEEALLLAGCDAPSETPTLVGRPPRGLL